MRGTPLLVSIMLACHVSPDPKGIIGADTWNSMSGKEVLKQLIRLDLIDKNYRSTSRGDFWVEHICSVPIPEQCWRIPETNE